MTDDTNTDETQQVALDGGEPADEEPAAEEIRQSIMERLSDCDGAMAVTATLLGDEDMPDDEREVDVTVARFVADDVPEDEAAALKMHISSTIMEHGGTPLAAMAIDASEGLGGALDALLNDIEAAVDEADENPDPDAPEAGSDDVMFQ